MRIAASKMLAFLTLFSAGAGFADEAKPNALQRPNIIFILMDDMGYSDVSCYGVMKVKTPNIDHMAAEGLQFTDFHTAASICSPSRAALLTGSYPQRAGLCTGINPNREAHWFLGLNPDEITIAEQFKGQGYTTAMVGKWHLGMQEKFLYWHQGFDHHEFMVRGPEQRPTGTLFPEVPILSNQAQDWDPLSDEEEGRGKTQFKGANVAHKKTRRRRSR